MQVEPVLRKGKDEQAAVQEAEDEVCSLLRESSCCGWSTFIGRQAFCHFNKRRLSSKNSEEARL